MSGGGRQEGVLVSRRTPESPASAPGATPSVQSPRQSLLSHSLPRPLPSKRSHCLLGWGGGEEGVLLSFPLAGKIPPLMLSACVKVLKWMSGDVFLSYFPLSQRMFPTPPSVSGLRFSVLVRAWLPMA